MQTCCRATHIACRRRVKDIWQVLSHHPAGGSARRGCSWCPPSRAGIPSPTRDIGAAPVRTRRRAAVAGSRKTPGDGRRRLLEARRVESPVQGFQNPLESLWTDGPLRCPQSPAWLPGLGHRSGSLDVDAYHPPGSYINSFSFIRTIDVCRREIARARSRGIFCCAGIGHCALCVASRAFSRLLDFNRAI